MRTLTIASVALLGLALGDRLHRSSPSESAAALPGQHTASEPPESFNRKEADPAHEAIQLDDVVGAFGAERLSLLARFLAGADSEAIGRLASALADDRDHLEWRLLFARWFEIDAIAAEAFARGEEEILLLRLAIESWAATDPEAARAALPPANFMLGEYPWNIGYAIWESDPERFWRLVEAAPGSIPRAIEVPREAILSLLETDPKLAAEHAKKYRYEVLEDVFSSWAKTDPDGLIEWSFPGRLNSTRSVSPPNGLLKAGVDPRVWAIEALAAVDPILTAKVIDALPGTIPGTPFRAALALEWSQTDPTAALEWAGSLEDLDRRNAIVAIAHGVANDDSALALKLLDSIEWGLEDVRGYNRELASPIWGADFRYMTMMASPPETSGRTVAIRVLSELAKEEPAAAMNYAQQVGSEVTREVFASAAPLHADAAIDWIASLPEGTKTFWYWKEVADSIKSKVGGAERLRELADKGIARHDAFDLAYEAAAALALEDPAAAFRWARSLPEGRKRRDTVVSRAMNSLVNK